MKIAGHMMAVPGMSVPQALDLFARQGLAGLEAVSMPRQAAADSYRRTGRDPEAMLAGEGEPFSIEWSGEARRQLRDRASRTIPVITVTPYVRALNHPDPDVRSRAAAEMRANVDLAVDVGARYVRVYGGEARGEPTAWRELVGSLAVLADYAAARGVTLLLENHPGTMTVTGQATAAAVRQVASPHLRALYDPANVMAHSDEPARRTFEVQRDVIGYVHVKDFHLLAGQRPRACLVGEGDVPWPDILSWLADAGYDGWFCLEYEKKWAPDLLPEAEAGLPVCRDFLRGQWPG
jgi:L-ribulose-5-phosphate 3-epimerase